MFAPCTEVFTLLKIIVTTTVTIFEPEKCFSTVENTVVTQYCSVCEVHKHFWSDKFNSIRKDMIENITIM